MENVRKLSYLRKIFYLTYAVGLAVGLLFPLSTSLIIGPVAFTFPYTSVCLATGFVLATIIFLLLRTILKQQLKQQMKLLTPLVGEVVDRDESIERLMETTAGTVDRIISLVRQLFATTDKFVPHYRALAEVSHFLSERAKEGLIAARQASLDMQSMEEKQQQVLAQVQVLTEKAQGEASCSKELSASLVEMSGALEHSTAKFLETTATVDQMAASIREVVAQADEVAHSVEGTAHDLDAIGDSLAKIQSGAVAGAQSANTVKEDAENGLRVVQRSMEEMTRIEEESRKATAAMQRLSQQTKEVAKIIEVIKELVSDTELLAFNAAIIAAKAGEEGKGFSVVAEEIRDLADRTTTSAQDIQQIVKAIGGDTREVTAAVEATAKAIGKGKELSHSTGEALRKIVDSSNEAAASSDEIADLTEQQGRRARALLNNAGRSLQSVKAIHRIVQEQEIGIIRTQDGVTHMKVAADQVAIGMAEQVKANQMFNQGLAERETQVRAINEATRHQISSAGQVLQHFAKSEQRLLGNAQKAAIVGKETVALEALVARLKELAATLSYLDPD